MSAFRNAMIDAAADLMDPAQAQELLDLLPGGTLTNEYLRGMAELIANLEHIEDLKEEIAFRICQRAARN